MSKYHLTFRFSNGRYSNGKSEQLNAEPEFRYLDWLTYECHFLTPFKILATGPVQYSDPLFMARIRIPDILIMKSSK